MTESTEKAILAELKTLTASLQNKKPERGFGYWVAVCGATLGLVALVGQWYADIVISQDMIRTQEKRAIIMDANSRQILSLGKDVDHLGAQVGEVKADVKKLLNK